MAEVFSNRAESTLASGISGGATSITVQTGEGAEFPATGDFSILLQDATVATTYELVKCTARAGDVLTVTATANAWDAGDKVVQVLDKRVMDILATHTEAVLVAFSQAGVLTVGAGTHRLYAPGGVTWTIAEVRASVGTAPTGAALIVDVHKSTTTIFTTQSNRPEIAISGFTDLSGTIEVASLASGEYLTVDIDQIGSTVVGSDLTVAVLLTRTV